LLKNHALAMSIQDNGWRMFLSMLTIRQHCTARTSSPSTRGIRREPATLVAIS
jgi:hypothetical protein